MAYIYKITNTVNNKVYIGQIIQSIKNRWYRHCANTKSISKEEKNMLIKRAILKYGKESFKIEIIEECNPEDLDDRECYYIKYYDSYNNGYNCTLGGQKGAKPVQTPENIQKEIISLYKEGFSLREIAKEYSIDKATVKGILVRNNLLIRDVRNYKFSNEVRQAIINAYNNGTTRKEIINTFHISKSYLSQLISGKRRI